MKREYLYAGGAVLALVLGYVVYKKFGDVIATTLNPASDKNAAYTGINAAAHAAGLVNKDDTIGTALYGAVDTFKGWFGAADPDPTAPTPARPMYDYGNLGTIGPYRSGWILPDPFNPDTGFILQ